MFSVRVLLYSYMALGLVVTIFYGRYFVSTRRKIIFFMYRLIEKSINHVDKFAIAKVGRVLSLIAALLSMKMRTCIIYAIAII